MEAAAKSAGTTVSELRGTTVPFTSLQSAVSKNMIQSLKVRAAVPLTSCCKFYPILCSFLPLAFLHHVGASELSDLYWDSSQLSSGEDLLGSILLALWCLWGARKAAFVYLTLCCGCAQVPEFRVSYTITTDKFDALYKKLKPKGVTLTALLAKACGVALASHPLLYACARVCPSCNP